MKILYLPISLFFCTYLLMEINTPSKNLEDPYIVEELSPEVTAFNQKIYNYNVDEVLEYLLQDTSCNSHQNLKQQLYLTINKNALMLEEKYSDAEKIASFYKKREYAKIKKINSIHKKSPMCQTNVKRLKEKNTTWEEYFREAYEIVPVIKKLEYKKDILVAIIDTGATFKDPIINRAIPNRYKRNIKQLNFSQSTDFDEHGHGTHVAGIVLGVMPQVKLLPLKYFNANASGEENLKANLKSLEYAINQNVNIINYSGGGPDFDQREFDLLKKAQEKGIIVVAAAGNEGSDIDDPKNYYYPANYDLDNIVVIGNSKGNYKQEYNGFEISPESNYGRKSVDFIMKGYRVKSLVGNGADCWMDYYSGTSMSTPAFTGVIASLMSQYPEYSYQDILNHLKDIANPIDTNSRYGYLELSPALNSPINENKRKLASNSVNKIK